MSAARPCFALAERYGVGVDGRHPGLLNWYTVPRTRPGCATTPPAGWG